MMFRKYKLILSIGNETVLPHFGQLVRQGAAVYAKIIGKLLSGKRYGKLVAAILNDLFRKIGQ